MPHLPLLALGLLSLCRPSPITNTLFSGSFFGASHKPSCLFSLLGFPGPCGQEVQSPPRVYCALVLNMNGQERPAFMGLPLEPGWGCARTHNHPVATPSTLSSRRVLAWGGHCSLKRGYSKCLALCLLPMYPPLSPWVLPGRE